jgi:hypothetical protein
VSVYKKEKPLDGGKFRTKRKAKGGSTTDTDTDRGHEGHVGKSRMRAMVMVNQAFGSRRAGKILNPVFVRCVL